VQSEAGQRRAAEAQASTSMPDSEARRAVPAGRRVVDVRNLVRSFGKTTALDGISLSLASGEIHALLGPNGAGKTTLVRVLAGLVLPSSGDVRIAGFDPGADAAVLRRQVGLVPSGDRSFYLRISGLENLVFFARLHGLSHREAVRRAHQRLRSVGLERAARVRVGVYSHGMQKRLSVARALLTDPQLLLVDEATHDLDPEGAEAVRTLVREQASRGTTVLWATQRLDEIRGLADNVTLLKDGTTRFQGSVPQLLSRSSSRRFVLTLRSSSIEAAPLEGRVIDAVGDLGTVVAVAPDTDHYLLSLREGMVLGRALSALNDAGIDVVGCQGERSEAEEAFLSLLRETDL
jgi:ABC-2 type transport system ATP-binding protein